MAAYAAFKHVELYNVGKTKKRVLRPPGGGSSDIFGTDLPQTPRSAKNHMQSHIFSAEKNFAVKNNGDQTRRAQKTGDSYSHLFGEPNRPNTPPKNHMKSSILFGKNTEATAAQLLANGNGHHHLNDKSGSVSSASSSVSSSTENLKINGFYKSVDEACPQSDSTESGSVHIDPLETDLPCDEKSVSHSDQSDSKLSDKYDVGTADVSSNTRRESGCNSDNPYSLSKISVLSGKKDPLGTCIEMHSSTPARNPITGLGLGEDGVGGIKPKKRQSRRDGNPVTGEGYKSGTDLNSSVASLNGTKQVINKNRIPPGGFSSGLW